MCAHFKCESYVNEEATLNTRVYTVQCTPTRTAKSKKIEKSDWKAREQKKEKRKHSRTSYGCCNNS